ncbi:MAG: PLP-dependent cysteine synthase family protein [Candidatus Heimdallarchaeota archaeon]
MSIKVLTLDKPVYPSSLIKNHGILGQIGNTPLIELNHFFSKKKNVKILAKAEWLNPGGSVKDRAALYMVAQAIQDGKLTKEKIILDASSGNTGIGYALVGAALGYRVMICIPKNASPERLRLLKAYGAELVLTDPLEGIDEAILTARKMKAADPDLYYYPDQYSNEANWMAHYHTTGKEIWEQTQGRVTHFVAGLGTTGTFTGTSRFLKSRDPKIQTIALQPDSPFHGLEGLKHMETSLVPAIYDSRLVDEMLFISSELSQSLTQELARKEGLLIGPSSGAALAGVLQIAERIEKGVIVTVFPDRGDRYLSGKFWE